MATTRLSISLNVEGHVSLDMSEGSRWGIGCDLEAYKAGASNFSRSARTAVFDEVMGAFVTHFGGKYASPQTIVEAYREGLELNPRGGFSSKFAWWAYEEGLAVAFGKIKDYRGVESVAAKGFTCLYEDKDIVEPRFLEAFHTARSMRIEKLYKR